MTTVTFIPKLSQQSVSWNDSTIWSTGVVPNDPAIDLIIPTITVVATGQVYFSTISHTESHSIGSLAISNNSLRINGALTVAGNVNVSTGASINLAIGGSLSAGSFDNNGLEIHGAGSWISSTGLFLNETQLFG